MPKVSLIPQPFGDSAGKHLAGKHLVDLLSRQEKDRFDTVRMAVAFAKASGARRIIESLRRYISNGGDVKAVLGIDHQGTSRQGLEILLDAGVEVYVFHEDNAGRTYHPKLYLFERKGLEGVALVGSNNLTSGGLYENFELGLRVDHDLTLEEDERLFGEMVRSFEWFVEQGKLLDRELLTKLNERGYLLDEAPAPSSTKIRKTTKSMQEDSLFPSIQMPARSSLSDSQIGRPPGTTETFVMILEGSNVVYARHNSLITIARRTIRDFNPSFWGWRDSFRQRKDNSQFWDRDVVVQFTSAYGARGRKKISIEDDQDPKGGALRIRSEQLISGTSEGDILVMSTAAAGAEFDYDLAIIPKSHAQFDSYRNLCTRTTPRLRTPWGYSREAPEIPKSGYRPLPPLPSETASNFGQDSQAER